MKRLDSHGDVVARFAPHNKNVLIVSRRGTTREASRYGYDRTRSAQARESTLHWAGRRPDARVAHRDEPRALHRHVGRVRAPGFCWRRVRRVSGSRAISRTWATRSSWSIRTSRRYTRRGHGGRRRIVGTRGH